MTRPIELPTAYEWEKLPLVERTDLALDFLQNALECRARPGMSARVKRALEVLTATLAEGRDKGVPDER